MSSNLKRKKFCYNLGQSNKQVEEPKKELSSQQWDMTDMIGKESCVIEHRESPHSPPNEFGIIIYLLQSITQYVLRQLLIRGLNWNNSDQIVSFWVCIFFSLVKYVYKRPLITQPKLGTNSQVQ